jgi:hypothetical protein
MRSSTITRPTSIPKSPMAGRASTLLDVQLQAKLAFMAQRDRKLLRHRHQAAIEVRRVPILRRPASRRLPQGGARQFRSKGSNDRQLPSAACYTYGKPHNITIQAKPPLVPITWPMDMRLVHRGYRAGRRIALRLQLDRGTNVPALVDSGKCLLFE